MWSVYESLLRINSSDVVSHTDSFRNGYYMRIIPPILGSVSDGGCSHARRYKLFHAGHMQRWTTSSQFCVLILSDTNTNME